MLTFIRSSFLRCPMSGIGYRVALNRAVVDEHTAAGDGAVVGQCHTLADNQDLPLLKGNVIKLRVSSKLWGTIMFCYYTNNNREHKLFCRLIFGIFA